MGPPASCPLMRSVTLWCAAIAGVRGSQPSDCRHSGPLKVIVGNMQRVSAPMSPPEKMLRAAAELLSTGGVGAVSTRAVAAAAHVHQPALYRQFGDKDGLLDAVIGFLIEEYLASKRELAVASDDPVSDLRLLWDLHIQFGLTQPDCYGLAYGRAHRGRLVAAARDTLSVLQEVIARIALTGRLKMSVERATALFHSCGLGFVLTQISVPAADRDPQLSEVAREYALSTILVSGKAGRHAATMDLTGRAVALHEALRGGVVVSLAPAECDLLGEWLNRIADRMVWTT
jgi:AcrR family transcriptional regulator